MFKKPKKKRHFPPGTFIPTRARVLAILQLCIAFSVICYNMGTPFLGEVFDVREQQSLYQSIMNNHLFPYPPPPPIVMKNHLLNYKKNLFFTHCPLRFLQKSIKEWPYWLQIALQIIKKQTCHSFGVEKHLLSDPQTPLVILGENKKE